MPHNSTPTTRSLIKLHSPVLTVTNYPEAVGLIFLHFQMPVCTGKSNCFLFPPSKPSKTTQCLPHLHQQHPAVQKSCMSCTLAQPSLTTHFSVTRYTASCTRTAKHKLWVEATACTVMLVPVPELLLAYSHGLTPASSSPQQWAPCDHPLPAAASKALPNPALTTVLHTSCSHCFSHAASPFQQCPQHPKAAPCTDLHPLPEAHRALLPALPSLKC